MPQDSGSVSPGENHSVRESTESRMRRKNSQKFERFGSNVPFPHESPLARTQYCVPLPPVSRWDGRFAFGAEWQQEHGGLGRGLGECAGPMAKCKMSRTDPRDGLEVFKLQDSLEPPLRANRRDNSSVFNVARRQEIVFEKKERFSRTRAVLYNASVTKCTFYPANNKMS
ncbi:hypothetical protein NPIL_166701 [Nephila pilipes]|uniref:Uncharacterized protein n=1 Tax=Nephila pilipes TaxID=299642 RepID=A0A8X6Q3Y3_NEPPI|nr:hypothetical protein NPIL_166701 [Nephila pilipes]